MCTKHQRWVNHWVFSTQLAEFKNYKINAFQYTALIIFNSTHSFIKGSRNLTDAELSNRKIFIFRNCIYARLYNIKVNVRLNHF